MNRSADEFESSGDVLVRRLITLERTEPGVGSVEPRGFSGEARPPCAADAALMTTKTTDRSTLRESARMMRGRDSIVYAFSGSAYRCVSLVTSVLLRRVIAPEQFGLWNLVQVINEFVGKFDLGTSAAIERHVPVERGRDDAVAVRGLQSSALVLVIAQGALSAGAVLVWCAFAPHGLDDRGYWFVWAGAAALVLFSPLVSTSQSIVQAHGRFEHAGYFTVVLGLLNTVLTFVGGLLGGARGLVAGGVAASALSAVCAFAYLRTLHIPLSLASVSKRTIGRILKFGLPLRVADYPSTVFLSIDGLAVALMHSRAELAVYATARLFSGAGFELATRLTSAERNQWLVRMGRNDDDRAFSDGVWHLLRVQALFVLPTLALATYVGAEILTRVAMPQYLGTLPILRVLLIGWLFLPQSSGLRDLWVARGNFTALFVTGVIGLAAFAAALMGLRSWRVVEGPAVVATAYVMSCAVYITVLLAWVGRKMWGPRRAVAAVGHLLMSAGAVFGLTHLATLPSDSQIGDAASVARVVGQSALALLVFVAVSAGRLRLAEGRTS